MRSCHPEALSVEKKRSDKEEKKTKGNKFYYSQPQFIYFMTSDV